MTNSNSFSPLVQDTTKAQNESIRTILGKLDDKEVYIPDYQRDSEQWDDRKQSLFIESLLNNLTIPAFFFCEGEDLTDEVVDGQQRLSTIWKFYKNELTMIASSKVDYIAPQSILYSGKKFNDLDKKLQKIFLNYPLTIIYLPKDLTLETKLEIFRRINEGGTPLSGQDIRLAYYSESKSVTLIRLVGIHKNPTTLNNEDSENDEDSQKPFQRMVEIAKKQGLSNPWDNFTNAREMWCLWWEGQKISKGQTPSLMFLWYLVCLDRNKLKDLLENPTHLKIRFGGSTENALDIYCAQLKHQDLNENETLFVSSFDEIQNRYFREFAKWIEMILSSKLPGITVNKYKQLALFIAGAVELGISPEELSDEQWNSTGNFIRSSRKFGKELLGGDNYPEPKGLWSGKSGQFKQCDTTVEIVRNIFNK